MNTRISITKIKHAAFASEETSCFSATLVLDGVPIGTVSNDGHGGCNDYNGNADKISEAEAYAKTLPPMPNDWDPAHPLDMDLDLLVGELFEAWQVEKDFVRQMRKCAFIADGKLRYVTKSKAGDPVAEAWILKKYPAAVILARLPRAEALAAFKKAVAP